MSLVGIPERRMVFDRAVREGTYGPIRMALYKLAPSLIVQSGFLEKGLLGCYDAEFEAITIDRTMILDDKKCILIHELAHWVYDDDSRPPYGAKREQETRRLAASALIAPNKYRQAETMYEGDTWLMALELGVNPTIIHDYQRYVIPTLLRGRITSCAAATC